MRLSAPIASLADRTAAAPAPARIGDARGLVCAGAAILALLVALVPGGAAQTSSEVVRVPPSWSLVPDGLTLGDKFRLLLVTTDERRAGDARIATYDKHVRNAVKDDGHADLRPHSDHFKVLGSTASVNARTHTKTTSGDTSVPIYWVGGKLVAASYADLYGGADGTAGWANNEPRNEAGEVLTGTVAVFTGTNQDGTTRGGTGSLGNDGSLIETGRPLASGRELGGTRGRSRNASPLYGLSGVFVVSVTFSASAPSVAEGGDGETASLHFEVALSEAISSQATVEYADSSTGTATSGTDYEALTAGTLTFPAGTTVRTVTVNVKGDDVDEADETVVLRLSNPTGSIEFPGGAATHDVTGVIGDDDLTVGQQVAATWGLVPEGLVATDRFRLLFVTSQAGKAENAMISHYDGLVQAAAEGGSPALRVYASHFKVLASTASVSARDHTGTTPMLLDQGVPVYWLDGDKVAEHYADLYDGDWLSNDPVYESGASAVGDSAVFTGSSSDGTIQASGRTLGTTTRPTVVLGQPEVSGKEFAGAILAKDGLRRFYGLSGVFTVVAAGAATLAPASLRADRSTVTLEYPMPLDPDFVPASGDFSVSSGTQSIDVSAVSVSSAEVVLTLESAVRRGAAVRVSYTPGTPALRAADGSLAAAFAPRAAVNETKPTVSVGAPTVLEGEAGSTAALHFEVTLDGSASQPVTVEYSDPGTGTAAAGSDYVALTAGTLTFTPGATSLTISVTVNGDGDYEGDETVALQLSGATGADFERGEAVLQAVGTILNDDQPIPVPPSWSLVPDGLALGDKFRLLLVTTDERRAGATGIDTYDQHVQSAVRDDGHTDLRPHSDHFKVLGSTASVNARTHTKTTSGDTSVPIYWVGGKLVAASYADLYGGADGTAGWANNEPRNEAGEVLTGTVAVFTGTNQDGTTRGGTGSLGNDGSLIETGRPLASGRELGGTRGRSRNASPLYGLSEVFVVSVTFSAGAPSVAEGDDGETASLHFEVALSEALSSQVIVEYADASTGTATAGTDYEALTAGTLTFAAGTTAKTVTVTVKGDDMDEADETVVLRLSNPTGVAELPGGAATYDWTGVIGDDDPPVGQQVVPTWSLVPPGLVATDKFRLLFVTSQAGKAENAMISHYDGLVQTAAAGGSPALSAYAAHFKVLASTASVSARDHTGTTPTEFDQGVPVYWLDGDKVADHYGDLYDGDWQSSEPVHETGAAAGSGAVFTGSNSDGTIQSAGRTLGTVTKPNVTVGQPHVEGRELAGAAAGKDDSRRFYGLSGVFTVVAAGAATLVPDSLRAKRSTVRLEYPKPLDPGFLPASGDFSVTSGTQPVAVSEVAVSSAEVVLTLAGAVRPGADVRVSFTPATPALRASDGSLAAAFTSLAAVNDTQPVVSVSAPTVAEGKAGSTAALKFVVALDGSASHQVTVEYSDPGTGTAAAGSDYATLTAGTLTFTPGKTSLTISVTVNGDGDYEGDETVAVELSGVTGAEFEGEEAVLQAVGTILDDDHPVGYEVPYTWSLIPDDLRRLGKRFRLLFVTSTKRDATAESLDAYDQHVADAAASGRVALQPYSARFRVLGSSKTVDARDHSETAYSGIYGGLPIYWVGGDKVADDYRDFYDGNWDSNAAQNESGGSVGSAAEVFTGSASDGTKDPTGRYLGTTEQGAVGVGTPGERGSELASGDRKLKSSKEFFYGLSEVFVVGGVGTEAAGPVSGVIDGKLITVTFGEELDPAAVPDPFYFLVRIDQKLSDLAVTEVKVAGSDVKLKLDRRVVGGQAVTLYYKPSGVFPEHDILLPVLRNGAGMIVGQFLQPLENHTLPELSVSSPRVAEGDAGELPFLDFEVTLSVSPRSDVTVEYADHGSGAGLSGTDYQAITAGTLTFAAGQTADTVRVTVVGDADYEPDESVRLVLSNPSGATLEGGGKQLVGEGTILNDDSEVGTDVPATWGLVPADLQPGDSFRLLFVTSGGYKSSTRKLPEFDAIV